MNFLQVLEHEKIGIKYYLNYLNSGKRLSSNPLMRNLDSVEYLIDFFIY